MNTISRSPLRRQNGGPFGLLLLSITLSVLAAGCSRSPREYGHFGQLGTTYTTAMDQVLVAAVNVETDANSEFMLRERINRGTTSTIKPEEYELLVSEEKNTVQTIGRLRRHTALLSRYFTLLYAVATSNQPAEITSAVTGAANSLNGLGEKLRGKGTDEAGKPIKSLLTPAQITGIAQISGMVAASVIRKRLRDQLNQDNKVIRQELTTQDELLKAISAKIEHDVALGNQAREKRLVIDAITAVQPIPENTHEEWIANRRKVRTADTTVAALGQASNAAAELQEAYVELINGKLSTARVNDVLTDLQSLLSFAEAIQKVSGGQ